MAPKKQQKMSLNEFLGDSTLGSWADEMDSLPTAPSARQDDDRGGRRGGDDFLSSRPDRGDRQAFPPREDLPLPTQPPYTAFVGNLAFDLTELDLESFFGSLQVKSAKVIKDRDDRPKGFGYVEFESLDDLKGAIAQTGTSLSGRTVRVSVAEPPKERSGFGGGAGGGFGSDDSKFAEPWRRAGPLPDLPNSRDSSRRRFDSTTGPGPREPPPPSVADTTDQWRSSRRGPPPPPEPTSEGPGGPPRRRGPGFFAGDGASVADKEETWAIGSKFKPSSNGEEGPSSRGSGFGSGFRRGGDMGPPNEPSPVAEEKNWRNSARPPMSRQSTSPNSSVPPTPQTGRRKLELLPRSGAPSTPSSPLSSPKMQNATANTAPRANPFGSAKPVDVTAKESAVEERLAKEREAIKERAAQAPMSRTTSRGGFDRSGPSSRGPPSNSGSVPPSPRVSNATANSANVRPATSFAAAASARRAEAAAEKAAKADEGEVQKEVDEVEGKPEVSSVIEQLGEVTI